MNSALASTASPGGLPWDRWAAAGWERVTLTRSTDETIPPRVDLFFATGAGPRGFNWCDFESGADLQRTAPGIAPDLSALALGRPRQSDLAWSEGMAVDPENTPTVYRFDVAGHGAPVYVVSLGDWDGEPVLFPAESYFYDTFAFALRDELVVEFEDLPPPGGLTYDPDQSYSWDYVVPVSLYQGPAVLVEGESPVYRVVTGGEDSIHIDKGLAIQEMKWNAWGTGFPASGTDENTVRFTLEGEGSVKIDMRGLTSDEDRLYEWTLEYISEDIGPAPGVETLDEGDWVLWGDLLYDHYYEDNVL